MKFSCRMSVGLPQHIKTLCLSVLWAGPSYQGVWLSQDFFTGMGCTGSLYNFQLPTAVPFLVELPCSVWVLSEKPPLINLYLSPNQELRVDSSDFRSLWLHRHCCVRQPCLCLANALEEVSPVRQVVFMAWQIDKGPWPPSIPLSTNHCPWTLRASCTADAANLSYHSSAASRALPWQRVARQCHLSARHYLSSPCPAAEHEDTSGAWTHTEWGHEGQAGGQEGRKGNQMRILTYTGPKSDDAVCMQGG